MILIEIYSNIFAGMFFQTTKGETGRKAWPAGVAPPGQRAQHKGVAIGAEGMAGCRTLKRLKRLPQ